MVSASALVRISLATARACPSKQAIASAGSISSICSSRARVSVSSTSSLVLIQAAWASRRLLAPVSVGETDNTFVTTPTRANAGTPEIGTHQLQSSSLTASKQVRSGPVDTTLRLTQYSHGAG